jgi:hypothetical protein
MKDMKMAIPILLDPIEGDYLKAYGGYPAGTAVIDIEGKIAHWGRGAPNGAKPKDAEAVLKKLVDAGGAAIADKWERVKYPRPAKDKEDPTDKKETDKVEK